ncbi:MAG: RNA 3'-terminal phosphate cyclase [Pirellula sp.]
MNDEHWIEIDGSRGEGGGQMLRSSLALSMVTGRPVAITNVRAGRDKPGLKRQHLTCVHAAAEISSAKISGDHVGSQFVSFEPKCIAAGTYRFSIGTAGSASLVLQTVLPALMIASTPSQVIVEGGTHNDFAPPYEFLKKAYLPLLNRMGPSIDLSLVHYGFYPIGGGEIRAKISPSESLKPFDLIDRGKIVRRHVTACVAGLPLHIADREVDVVRRGLDLQKHETSCEEIPAKSPGNYLWIEMESNLVTEVITGFGRPQIKAERVARDALKEAKTYDKANVPVGVHLADQWMLPLAISAWQARQRGETGGGGRFKTLTLSLHAITHLEIIERFLGIHSTVQSLDDDTQMVSIGTCDPW